MLGYHLAQKEGTLDKFNLPDRGYTASRLLHEADTTPIRSISVSFTSKRCAGRVQQGGVTGTALCNVAGLG